MICKYKKKNQRGTWSHKRMIAAIRAIEGGMSIKTAVLQHAVPRTTLRRKVPIQKLGENISKRIGRGTVLTTHQEDELEALIIDMENKLFGLTMTDVRRSVFQYCSINVIKHPFDKV